MSSKQPQKKKTKTTTKKATRLGDKGRGLGGEGRDRDRGSRCRHVSSPRYVFFQCFLYILVTFFYSEMLLDDGNKGWEW